MAGLLSKGITLGYRGKAGNGTLGHTINAYITNTDGTISGDYIEISKVTENMVYITKVWSADPSILIGACVNNVNGSSVEYGLITKAERFNGGDIKITYGGWNEAYIATTERDGNAPNEEIYAIAPDDSENTFGVLTNLQEIAELGNNAPEKIDVTVLSDGAKKSISGLSDTAQDLAFKFLYEKAQFNELSALKGSKEWRVTLPDGTTATFTATPSVKLAGVGTSAALTYTLTLSVESEIVFA